MEDHFIFNLGEAGAVFAHISLEYANRLANYHAETVVVPPNEWILSDPEALKEGLLDPKVTVVGWSTLANPTEHLFARLPRENRRGPGRKLRRNMVDTPTLSLMSHIGELVYSRERE